MRVYCTYAEEFLEGDPCPQTGQTNCFVPLCVMLEIGDAYATDEPEDDCAE